MQQHVHNSYLNGFKQENIYKLFLIECALTQGQLLFLFPFVKKILSSLVLIQTFWNAVQWL